MDETKALLKIVTLVSLDNFLKMPGCVSLELVEVITCQLISVEKNLLFIPTGIITFMVKIGMRMHKKLTVVLPTCRACLPFSCWAGWLLATSTTLVTTYTSRPTRVGMVMVKI